MPLNDPMSYLSAPPDDPERDAAFWAITRCQLAKKSVKGLTDPDPARRQSERANYEHHRDEAIASALAIKDAFFQGFAMHQVINLCRSANDFEMAKTLFKKVDNQLLREQIMSDAPELAGEQKKWLAAEAKIPTTITIHLDGLDRGAIIHLVAKTMRDIGASKREIEGFKQDANKVDYNTMLAKAVAWGAPVLFLKDGQPWILGDWRRLTVRQHIERRFSLLWRGSYLHPDGTIETRQRGEAMT
jgi:hypothetical protein